MIKCITIVFTNSHNPLYTIYTPYNALLNNDDTITFDGSQHYTKSQLYTEVGYFILYN